MQPDLAAIRQFIIAAYNDEELVELCFDHFPEVYRDFSADMATSQKAIRLIGYCERRSLLPRLLRLLADARPVLYASEFGLLKGKHDHRVPRKERLDLNHADGRELQWLPGIGPKLARAIVDKRPYASVEELRHVPGIGSKRFEALRGLVRV